MQFNKPQLLLWLLLLPFYANAQNKCELLLKGKVISSFTQSPLNLTEVFCENGHRYATTNADGMFSIKLPCDSVYLIEFTNPEHQHLHLTLTRDSINAILIVELQPLVNQIDPVYISKSTNPIINKQGVDGRQFKAHQDFASQLNAIPGVNILSTGNLINKPMAEGLFGWRLPVAIEGVRLATQPWGLEHALEINSAMVEHTTLNYDVPWGDAFSGVLQIGITPNAPLYFDEQYECIFGYARNGHQIQTQFRGIELHNHPKKSYTFYALSIKTSGDQKSKNYYLTNSGFKELSAKWGRVWSSHESPLHNKSLVFMVYANESALLRNSLVGNNSDLLKIIQKDTPLFTQNLGYHIDNPRQQTLHGLVIYKQQLKPNKQFLNDRQLTFSTQWNRRSEFEFHRNSSLSFPQLDLYLFGFSAEYHSQFYLTRLFNHLLKKEFRIKKSFISETYSQSYGGYYFMPAYFQQKWNASIQATTHRFSIHGAFESQLLYAYDIQKYIKNKERKIFIQPVFALNYVNKYLGNNLNISAGRYWRIPGINELYSNGIHRSGASFELGNPMLQHEVDYQVRINNQRIIYFRKNKSTPYLELYSRCYLHYFPNFINLTPQGTILTVRGELPSFKYEQFRAFYAGTDLSVSMKFRHLNIGLMSGFIYARDLTHQLYPSFIPPLFIRGKIQYHWKSLIFLTEFQSIFRQFQYEANSELIPPPPPYTLINISIQFNSSKKRPIKWIIGSDNLLNTAYREYLDRFRFFADRPGRNMYLQMQIKWHHSNPEFHQYHK